MKLDLRALAKDRKAQLVAGAGVVLGLVVLLRRSAAGSSSSAGGSSGATSSGLPSSLGSSGGGGGGSYDSTASDIAGQLGSFAQQQQLLFTHQQQQLDQFGSQLTAGLDSIANRMQSTPTTPDTAVPTPSSATTPVTQPPAAVQTGTTNGTPTGSINRGTIGSQVAQYVTVGKGQSWNTVAGNSNVSIAQLRQLNGGQLNALKPGQKVRIN